MRRMEGDHGSIVAFRIPCHPSVGFHPSPSFAPSTTTADLHPLQLASSFRALHYTPPLTPAHPPSSPRSPLPPSSHCATLRLARSPQPSTLVAVVVVLAPSTCTRRYAGPDPPTRQRTLSLLSSSLFLPLSSLPPVRPLFLGLFPPFFLSFVSLLPTTSRSSTHSVSLVLWREHYVSSSLLPSFSFTSRRYPSRRVASRRRVKLAAQSRSVA